MSPSSSRLRSIASCVGVLGFPGAAFGFGALAFAQEWELKHREDARVLQAGHQAVGVQPVADKDRAAVLVNRRQHVRHGTIGRSCRGSPACVPNRALQRRRRSRASGGAGGCFRPRIFCPRERGEYTYPVVEDAVHRLPVLVALKRRLGAWVVDLLVFQVAVITENEVVVAQLVLDAGGVDARLASRIS